MEQKKEQEQNITWNEYSTSNFTQYLLTKEFIDQVVTEEKIKEALNFILLDLIMNTCEYDVIHSQQWQNSIESTKSSDAKQTLDNFNEILTPTSTVTDYIDNISNTLTNEIRNLYLIKADKIDFEDLFKVFQEYVPVLKYVRGYSSRFDEMMCICGIIYWHST